jgi:hypothetical protein
MAALAAIAVLVAAASGAAFAESYRGLYAWAHEHGLTGGWAVIWPLQVDVFIAVGELALFVALVDRWAPRSRWAAWAVTGAGLAVSVAGNVGHVAGHSVADRVTAALPPVAAAFALAVALGVLKRVVEAHHEVRPRSVPVRVPLPAFAAIRGRRKCSQKTAEIVRAEVQLDRRNRDGVATPAVAVPAGDAPPPERTPAGAHPTMNGSHGA